MGVFIFTILGDNLFRENYAMLSKIFTVKMMFYREKLKSCRKVLKVAIFYKMLVDLLQVLQWHLQCWSNVSHILCYDFPVTPPPPGGGLLLNMMQYKLSTTSKVYLSPPGRLEKNPI